MRFTRSKIIRRDRLALASSTVLRQKLIMVYFHNKWRPRRSVLFMPASNIRALQKAPDLDCDTVIFDLEDAVGAHKQEEARQNLLAHVKDKAYNGKERIIRVSETGHENHTADMEVALQCKPDAILLPKVEAAEQIEKTNEVLKSVSDEIQIWIMVESPKALFNLGELVKTAQSTNLGCLVIGPNDLARTTGVKMQAGRAPMLPWLMQVVAAARAFDLCVLDGVFNRFKDLEGLEAECEQGAAMGFDGKTLIHPTQIAAANKYFAPGDEEFKKARDIVALFSSEENAGIGAVQMDGEMVEPLHFEMAKNLLKAYGKTEQS